MSAAELVDWGRQLTDQLLHRPRQPADAAYNSLVACDATHIKGHNFC